jgi:phosphatidylethanolamine/phosphatidyl-N-methylethanolamine N-methyltransferase
MRYESENPSPAAKTSSNQRAAADGKGGLEGLRGGDDHLRNDQYGRAGHHNGSHASDPHDVISTYRRFAPVYDRLFGFILDHGRRELAKAVCKENPASLLEIGVGTGLMLHRYPQATEIIGIDLSDDMLAIAQQRADKLHNKKIRLLNMNAEALDFPDDSFDCVTLPYVLSVTPNPEKLVHEIRRVCRKDGTIFILGHFSGGRLAWAVDGVTRMLARKVRFQSDFSYEKQVLKYDWEVKDVSAVNLLGISRLVEIKPALQLKASSNLSG